MNQANGRVERELRIQKRKILNKIHNIKCNIQNLSAIEIQEQLYDIRQLLKPQTDMPWLPQKFYKLYKFLLVAIDPCEHIKALSRKSNFHQNVKLFNSMLKPIKTNLLQSKGESLNGIFGGIVHKNDIAPNIYSLYFPKSVVTIYTDTICLLTNQTYISLETRDERIKDRLNLLLSINYRSASFYQKLKSQKIRYQEIQNMNWQPILNRCELWQPLPYESYLNNWQLHQFNILKSSKL